MPTDILFAETDAEIAACYPALRELRPALAEETFVARVRGQQAAGYRLAYIPSPDGPLAVAGFRLGESLGWGRYLYVDDLVVLAGQRSHGHGAALLAWLKDYAAKAGCGQLHLDSGVQRVDAHRFYRRAGMALSGYHFRCEM